jgi:hypothetical protein
MILYKSKPVIISAEQWAGDNNATGVCNCDVVFRDGKSAPHLHTIHNNQAVKLEIGDYIVSEGDNSHYYPCKKDIFENKYERLIN